MLLLCILVFSFGALAVEDFTSGRVQCAKSAAFFAAPDSPDYRKYAPDREVQVLHLALDITPNFKQRTIQGTATIRFKPLLKPVKEVKLDAVDLTIESVKATAEVQAFQCDDEQLTVSFAEDLAPDKEITLTVKYSAEPTKGLYFRTPEMGYKEGDTHLFTQCESITARNWFPCFDSPNRMFTSELTCRVPEGMTVISNGRLESQTKDAATGLVAFHWVQDKPHANYLITLVAGYFKKVEDKYKDIPLAFYTPPSLIQYAESSFQGTKEMMEFFEKETGVPYPWAKYDQICVNDFVAGGMENTSATTLTDTTLFSPETENIRSSQGLVAHELAHQWFGDLVTCKDWSHTWLNEGFATYYETLFEEHKNGRDAMLFELYNRATDITNIRNDVNPIVYRTYDSPDDMFSYLQYPKGGWVLHMLRCQLGEDLYRRCIKTYLERHQYGNVVTEDLRRIIEELSGRTYDQFFDQWLYHAHHPELDVSYSWNQQTLQAKVSIRQVQKLGTNVLLFNFPLTIRFKTSAGVVDKKIQVTRKEEDFSFTLASAPTLVRLDPEYTLLAKITFNVPVEMLNAQLADKTDMIGRLLAVEQLSKRKDKASVAKLKQVLNEDPFYGVRSEAASSLRSIHTDEAFEALLASRNQSDARVRVRVMAGITGFYREEAYEAAMKCLQEEKNPEIISTALNGISGYAKPAVRETLLRFLNTSSFRNETASAAIRAMRSQDDPEFINPLMEALKKQEAEFPSYALGQGLSALGYLARNEEKKDEVRGFLLNYVNDKRRSVAGASINALGTLGDPKAIAALEKIAYAGKKHQESTTAERAVADLRAGRKPVDDFKNLRQEVLDLQKANRELRKEFDDFKSKTEKREAAAATNAPAKKKPLPAPKNKG